MEYLSNNICKLEPLFNFNPNIKKNIVSSSFFKAIISTHKDFNLYIDGLEKLYEKVISDPMNFSLRLFIDESVYKDSQLMSRINSLEKIELVLYKCKEYQIPNTEFHYGFFGTMLRFFPLFDFENNDANLVIICDIDDYHYFDINKSNVLKCKNFDKIYMLKRGNLGKNIIFDLEMLNHGNINPYSVASSFSGYKKTDHKVIIDFMKKMEKNPFKVFSNYKNKVKDLGGKIPDSIYKNYKNFIYGFDEYFLNVDYTNYLIKNKLPWAVRIKWSPFSSLFFYFEHYKNKVPKEEYHLIFLIFKYIFEKNDIKMKTNNIFKNYKLIEKLNQGKNKKLAYSINFYMYKLFIFLYSNKLYRFLFDEDIYKIILTKELFGIYSFDGIVYYNLTSPGSISFDLEKKSFKPNDINELKKLTIKHAKFFN
jgi:hypothetical protein